MKPDERVFNVYCLNSALHSMGTAFTTASHSLLRDLRININLFEHTLM